VITNACATQAILSVLLNTEGVDLGTDLLEFKAFCMQFDEESKGLAISNSDKIRVAHNSFAKNDSFSVEQAKSSKKGDAHHFIAYVPHQGRVYELDGLKAGPILLGEYVGDDWLAVAKPAIEERMSRYSASETHFALMSICKSRRAELSAQIKALEERLASEDPSVAPSLAVEIEGLREELQEELQKLQSQSEENARRRHNFTPFIIRLLAHLAKRNVLPQLRQSALEKARASAATRASRNKK
jgi:ubiquitin carboxyl-terminal hydrolase L5